MVVIADSSDKVGEGVLVLRRIDGVCDDGLSDRGVVWRHEDDLEGGRVGFHRGPGDGVAAAEVELGALLGLRDCDSWSRRSVSGAAQSGLVVTLWHLPDAAANRLERVIRDLENMLTSNGASDGTQRRESERKEMGSRTDRNKIGSVLSPILEDREGLVFNLMRTHR